MSPSTCCFIVCWFFHCWTLSLHVSAYLAIFRCVHVFLCLRRLRRCFFGYAVVPKSSEAYSLNKIWYYNSMELSTTREATSRTVTREPPNILWNPKVHYRIYERSPLVPILGQTEPVHTTTSYLSKIHLNIVHPVRLGLPSGLLPSTFPTCSL
jgi:hypothetical protein